MLDNRYERFLATLAHPKRFRIIHLLRQEGPLNVSQICRRTGYHQSTASHCLKRLSSCHYVFLKANGREHVYSLNEDTVAPLLRIIDKHVTKYCPGCAHAE